MRSALLILITVLVLGLLFAGYLWLEPAGSAGLSQTQSTLQPIIPTTRPTPGESSFVGDAEGVAVNRYDDQTGELVSRFRFDRSRQIDEDRMRVEQPVAEFYHDDDIIRVTGSHGIVVRPPVPRSGDRQALEGNDALAGMPSRGELSDVRIEWFDSADSASAADPMLTLTMNNVSFDNETFRIATEGYTAEGGTFVTGDQVPVTVVGDEMSFRGRGLILRWNDRDRRLELLEILHGESMLLSDPEVLSRLREEDEEPSDAQQSTGQDRDASRSSPAAMDSPTTAPATRPARSQPTYHARFEDAVRVLQSGEDVARGDSLIVNFRLPESSGGRRARRETGPTTRAARRQRQAAATQPSELTSPGNESIEVKWTGRMRITPLDAPLDQPLPAGETAVRLLGSPLELRNEGWLIDAAALAYRTDQEIARVSGSNDRPDITMHNDEGAVIIARELEHHPAQRFASMRGPGMAQVPLDPGAGQNARLAAQWQDVATFRLARVSEGTDEMVIQQADLSGAVRVAHPKFGIGSETLSLLFDPPTTPPTTSLTTTSTSTTQPSRIPPLRRAIARGEARVTSPSDDGQPPQALSGNSIEIDAGTTEAGGPYPRSITVIGNAVASGDRGELRANHLFTTLVPVPPTADRDDDDEDEGEPFALESLRAQDDVHFRGEDGTSADADQLTLEPGADGPVLQLVGHPTARLSNGRDAIAGPMIRYQIERQLADVLGAGSLHAVQEREDEEPRPVNVTWNGRVHVSGAENLIDVYDDVEITTSEPDQTRTTARAERVQIALRDAPTADGPDQTHRSSTQPSRPDGLALFGSGDADLLKGKEPSVVTLQDDVTVNSELRAGDGSIIRRGFLKAPRIIYDIAADYLDIPSAGEMLLEDHEKTESKDPQGTTAFAWTDSLTYAGEQSLVTMLGNVKIIHRPEGEEADKSFTILTHRVRAELAPDEEDKPDRDAATTQDAVAKDAPRAPTTRPALDDLTLRRVIADGWVRVWADEMEVHAEEATYDPQSRWLILSGTPERPVYIFNTTGDMTGTVREMRWNSQTGEVKIEGLQGNVR